MKSIKLISYALILSSGAFFMTGCGGTDEVDPQPVLEFIGGGNYTSADAAVNGGDSVTFGINVTHDSKLEKMEVTRIYDGDATTEQVMLDSNLDEDNFRFDLVGTARDATGTEEWTFTVVDKKGQSASSSITLTTTSSSGPTLITIDVDPNTSNAPRVWNFVGVNAGAWDLVNGGNLFSADDDADKDILDATTSADAGNWPATWTSPNNMTGFKRVASSYTWTNTTYVSTLQSVWDDSGLEYGSLALVNGDLIIARLRGMDNFALIEILDVASTTNDNVDYIEFRYKKAP